MGLLTDNPDPNTRIAPSVETTEGGVYHGILYSEDAGFGSDQDTPSFVVWRCDHAHSKSHRNVNSTLHTGKVWEQSAMNCARHAVHQWRYWRRKQSREDSPLIVGQHGLVSSTEVIKRDDQKYIAVDGLLFIGQVRMTSLGDRVLAVWSPEDPHASGSIVLERPKSDIDHPPIEPTRLKQWRTAAVMLRREVNGVVFKHPNETITSTSSHKLANEIVPKRKQAAPPPEPYIAVIEHHGERWFTIRDSTGSEVTTVRHRGRATRELEEQFRREYQTT